MPKFNVSVDHALERETAVDRLKGFSNSIRRDAEIKLTELSEVWDEQGNLQFSFRAMGMKVSGQMVTSAKEITVSGELPFAAALFRGAIEEQIRAKIAEAIDI